MVVFGQRWLNSGMVVVFRPSWFYSGKSCFIRETEFTRQSWLYSGKEVVFGQKCCIRANMVVYGQYCNIWTKVVVFDQSDCNRAKAVLYGKSGFIRPECLYSVKVVLFGQGVCIPSKVGVIGQKWLYSSKSGYTQTKLVVFGNVVVIGQK